MRYQKDYHLTKPSFAHEDYGYSCQVWLAVHISGEIYGHGNRYAWFSLQFNPQQADSSNPCEGYYILLSRAVQQKDFGNRLIRDYKTQLLDIVDREAKPGGKLAGKSAQAAALQREITNAPIEYYRPDVWLLDLQKIALRAGKTIHMLTLDLRSNAARKVKAPQILQPDEYLIYDLQDNEYEVIIRG